MITPLRTDTAEHAAHLGLHGVATSEVSTAVKPGQMGQFVYPTLFNTLATVGQYLLPFAFLVGAVLSAYGRHNRCALHAQGAATRPV